MRSRYSAYVVGDVEYLLRTWHPRTRPHDLGELADGWCGLEILDVCEGGEGDSAGVVEFVARNQYGDLHERSTFEKRAGRWMYIAGEIDPA